MPQVIIRKEMDSATIFEYKEHFVINVPNQSLKCILGEKYAQYNTIQVNEKISYNISDLLLNKIMNVSNKPDETTIIFPIAICLMVTKQCNMSCKYCLAKINNKKSIIINKANDHVNNISKMNSLCCWVTGGEPLLYEHLIELICCVTNDTTYITIDTNGLLLNKWMETPLFVETLIDKKITVRISLDGHNMRINNIFRSNFDDVVKNITKLQKHRVDIAINTVVSSANFKHLKEMADFVLSLKVNGWNLYQLQEGFAPKSALINNQQYLEAVESIAQYNNSGIRISQVHGNIPFSSIVINPDGTIFTSDTINGKNIILSNIYEEKYIDTLINHYGYNIKNHMEKYFNKAF